MIIAWAIPTYPIMSVRRDYLVDAVAGLKATGVALVAARGQKLYPAGFGDDPGLYYFVPPLAKGFAISANAATFLFFAGVLGLSVLAGSIGWYFYARDRRSWLLGQVGILLVAALAFALGDVYVLLPAAIFAAIPPLLALWRRNATMGLWLAVLMSVGILVGIGAATRIDVGQPVLAFATILLLGERSERLNRRITKLLVFTAAVTVPVLAVRAALWQRDAFLSRQVAGYDMPSRIHPFWHQIYIGLGFLSNDQIHAYRDEEAMSRVDSVAPGTTHWTPAYEAVLRREVFLLVTRSPLLVARTVAAKIGVLCMYLAVFANIGLAASFRYRKPAVLDLALGAALGVATIPGILAVPTTSYLEGFIALSVLFAAVSCEWAIGMRRRSEAVSRSAAEIPVAVTTA
jgi:hypothetical protein